jgi:hypothetical protein
MLAFARAAPVGSRLVGVRVGGGAGVRAWATVDRAGIERLALLAPRAAHVVIRGMRPGSCARVWRTPPQRVRRTCAAALDLPAGSMAVVTFGAQRAARERRLRAASAHFRVVSESIATVMARTSAVSSPGMTSTP